MLNLANQLLNSSSVLVSAKPPISTRSNLLVCNKIVGNNHIRRLSQTSWSGVWKPGMSWTFGLQKQCLVVMPSILNVLWKKIPTPKQHHLDISNKLRWDTQYSVKTMQVYYSHILAVVQKSLLTAGSCLKILAFSYREKSRNVWPCTDTEIFSKNWAVWTTHTLFSSQVSIKMESNSSKLNYFILAFYR